MWQVARVMWPSECCVLSARQRPAAASHLQRALLLRPPPPPHTVMQLHLLHTLKRILHQSKRAVCQLQRKGCKGRTPAVVQEGSAPAGPAAPPAHLRACLTVTTNSTSSMPMTPAQQAQDQAHCEGLSQSVTSTLTCWRRGKRRPLRRGTWQLMKACTSRSAMRRLWDNSGTLSLMRIPLPLAFATSRTARLPWLRLTGC
mmetsp:Transcript_13689/g.37000  ORF Transcript_13689/g.37000 Transcript_13689/m.37000 type:complete len:200 (-) Transcript_13689:407-1006(-)